MPEEEIGRINDAGRFERYVGGPRIGNEPIVRCNTCHRLVVGSRTLSHRLAHVRARVVWETSMMLNERGSNFQPGQQVLAQHRPKPARRRTTRNTARKVAGNE